MLGVFNMKETPCGSLGPCYLNISKNLRHRTLGPLPDIPCHNRHKPSGCSLSAGIPSGCNPFGCNPSGCSSFGSSRSCHHSRTSGRCKGHRGQLYQWTWNSGGETCVAIVNHFFRQLNIKRILDTDTSGGTKFMLLESFTRHPCRSTADRIFKSVLCGRCGTVNYHPLLNI